MFCFFSAWSYYQFQENRDEEGKAPYTAPNRSPLYPVWTACSSAPFWRPLHEPLGKGDHWPLWEDDGKFCTSFEVFPMDTDMSSTPQQCNCNCHRIINNEHSIMNYYESLNCYINLPPRMLVKRSLTRQKVKFEKHFYISIYYFPQISMCSCFTDDEILSIKLLLSWAFHFLKQHLKVVCYCTIIHHYKILWSIKKSGLQLLWLIVSWIYLN